MRKLAPLALLMLAGLAAMTFAPTAAAICAVTQDGHCSAPRHELQLAVHACPDEATRVCVSGPEAVDVEHVFSGINNLTVRNDLPIAIDLEAYITGRLDDANADGSLRVRADKLFTLHVPAGESLGHEFTIDGNASAIRFQALTADAREGELDAEVLHVMTMAGGMADDDGTPDDQSSPVLADDEATHAGKDAPYLGIVVVVGVLAAIVGFRRHD